MKKGSTLQRELKQSKPFKALEEEVMLNLTRTRALLSQPVLDIFRQHRLTDVTYNILRILRGAGPNGLICSEVRERMLTRVPDITRLVDRLVSLGFVERFRTEDDRRRVFQKLTPRGAGVLEEIDQPIVQVLIDQFEHMSADELGQLNDLLVKARNRR